MHIVHGRYVYNKFLCISDMDDMHTINLYTYHPCMICIDIYCMHIVCVQYMYLLWYTYQTQMICIQINLYTYHTWMTCIYIYCTHIVHGWYAYKFICMHIVHVRYAYQVLPALVHISDMDNCPLYTYCLCTICVPEQVGLGMHIGHRQYAYT